jgi:two-component system NtrC family sensor kinase
MKRKILIGFISILLIFLAGSVVAALYITQTTDRLDSLITLHQVEIQREDLIIRVQQVQANVDRNRVRSGGDVDVLAAQVQEMDRVMDSCVTCHHSPELSKGLMVMRDLAEDYKASISRLVTAVANQKRIAVLEKRVHETGQELLSMTQGMAFTANVHLQQKTQETMNTIRSVRIVLFATMAASFALAVVIVALLARGLDRQLRLLLDATRRIATGDLQHRVDVNAARGAEFRELGDSFNAMTRNLQLSRRQLVQSTKLAAIGELATNIAYEVNNPLTGVLGYATLLQKAEDIPENRKEQLRTIERETLRAREILKNLLDFSRRKPPQLVRTDLCSLVQDTLELVKGQARARSVEIVAECPAGLPYVAVDEDEMKQVFVNLINNAFSAMNGGGTLSLRCGRREDGPGRQAVVVEIGDTGHGIPEDLLDKVFEPFFTTRADGGGTGLGLSVSYMIVQNHGGRIEVDSTVGSGSVFRIALPV